MMLTATLAPHVAAYVHKSLSMMKDTCLIRRCVDRKNVFLARRAILNSSSYEELNFVLPETIASTEDIPKTMIFMDSRLAVCKATDHLLYRLYEIRGKLVNPELEISNDLVGDFSMALSLERREQLLEKFRKGECRILVTTEGAGMGIDIPDIIRVIQWQCTKLLNIATYYQRAGRAGRSPNLQSVAILFYQQSLSRLEGEYEIFTKDVNSASGGQIMLLTQSFDSGRDEDAIIRKGKKSVRNMLDNRLSASNTQNSLQDNCPDRQSDPRRVICRGILTQIGTKGCMREAILRYFDDIKHPDIDSNKCCDSCALETASDVPVEIRRLMPEYVPPELGNIGGTNASSSNQAETASSDTRNGSLLPIISKGLHISQTQINAVREALQMLREDILQSQWEDPEDAKRAIIRSSHFLSDKEIEKIACAAHKIYDQSTLAKYLSTHKQALQWAPIAPYVDDLLETIKYACTLHLYTPISTSTRRTRGSKILLSVEEEARKKEEARIARNTRRRELYALKKAQSSALLPTASGDTNLVLLVPGTVPANCTTSQLVSATQTRTTETIPASELRTAQPASATAETQLRIVETVSATAETQLRTVQPVSAHTTRIQMFAHIDNCTSTGAHQSSYLQHPTSESASQDPIPP